MSDDDAGTELRGKWAWKALPWAKYTACGICGEVRHCYGKSNDWMVCLGCFSIDENNAKLRRGGNTGKRSRYTYRRRRPKSAMVEVVGKMRAEGLVVDAIADELGISTKTVRNYLSMSRSAENGAASPLLAGPLVPRKEEPGLPLVPVSGDA